jgi:ADP-heptose:LPS heptosyltransferase
MKILVVKLSSLGDIVLATPSLRAIRARWPGARITVAVNREFVPVIAACPDVDDVLVRERTERVRMLKTLGQAFWAGWFRAGRFDLAIDLQGNFHSGAWTSLVRARRRAGLGGPHRGWEFCLPGDDRCHAVDRCGEVAARLSAPLQDRLPRLTIPPHEDRLVDDFLGRRGLPRRGFLVVHPCTAWRTKEWPIERYAELVRRLLHGSGGPPAVLITGTAHEEARAAELERLVGSPAVRSVAGCLPLGGCLALWARAAAFVGGDTGPMHASAAAGVPVVAVFGPTLPEVSGPVGPDHRVIQASRPTSHAAYRAPSGHEHMLAIEVEPVLDAVQDVLHRGTAVAPAEVASRTRHGLRSDRVLSS